MRQVVLFIAKSLDGYIANTKGDVSWLSGDGSEDGSMGSYEEFIKGVDTVILGRKTYEQIVNELSPDLWPYEGKQSYIVTSRPLDNKEGITFTNKDVAELVRELKEQEGENIWICGGAAVANALIKEDLIDRYHISVIPAILGDGIRLFDKTDKSLELKLVKTESYNGICDLIYERR